MYMRTVRCLSGKRGFSMLELVIVLLIMGMLSAIAMPYLVPTLKHSSLEGAADDLISAFSSGRSYALGGNTYSRIVVDAGARRLDIFKYNPDTNEWDDCDQPLELPTGISFAQGGVTFEDSTAIFDPHGSLMSGGSLVIEDGEGHQISLNALLASGRLRRI
jgi:prepilin-type N-terminal cleavage/methylation domain-containing protein